MSIANEITRIIGGKNDMKQYAFNGFGIVIPDSVTLDNYKYYLENSDYLAFYCDEAGTIGWKCSDASIARTIQYSKDFGATWTNLTSTTSGTTIAVNAGDIVWFKGSNTEYGTSNTIYNQFTLSNNAHVYGNVNSLTGNNSSVGAYCFADLFRDCNKLYTYDAKRIILPATTLAENCYRYMFRGCTSLTTAPELPATTAATYCYYGMFMGCTSLTSTPGLPATTAATYCYAHMFNGCSSLTTVLELPATTLADQCYLYMFRECTSLTTAPEILATTMAEWCCAGMFQNCTGLTNVLELPATVLAYSCYTQMFEGCNNLINAPRILPATTLAANCYYAMFRGCSSLEIAPVLPAAQLVYSTCYSQMFINCSNLKYIKALFTTTPSDDYTSNWVSGVAATGTFVKSSSATWNVTGINGVPTGWTVITE